MLPSLVWGHGLIVCDWQLKVSSKGFKINCQCQSQGETLEDRQSLSLTDWHTNWLNDWLLTRNVLLSCPDSDHVLSFLSTHLGFTHICGRRTPSCWLLVGTYTRALGLCIRTHSLGPWDYTSELIHQDPETLHQIFTSLPCPTLGTQQSEVDPICWSSLIMMQYVIFTPSFTSSCSVKLCNLRNIMSQNGKSNKDEKMPDGTIQLPKGKV